MPPRSAGWNDPYQDDVRPRKQELWSARSAIIELMPDGIQQILRSFRQCETRDAGNGWSDEAVAKLVTTALIIPSTLQSLDERAFCPLCGRGSTSAGAQGFSVPEGLRRHIAGWGSGQACSVFEAAHKLAIEYWNRAFLAAEREQEEAAAVRADKRRKSETLYLTAPDVEPVLVEQGLFLKAARTTEQLEWAEQRLIALDLPS